MTLPLLVYPHQVHDKDWLDKAIYLQHLVNQAPLKCIFKIHYSVDSGLPAWFCTQFEATRIPPSSPEMSQSVSKTKSPLIAWRARAKAAWDSAWECMCVLRSQDTQCVIHCEFLPWNSPPKKELDLCSCLCLLTCVLTCHLIGMLVTSLSESLFTSQWPVWGSSSKCHPPPALSMFPQICTTVSVSSLNPLFCFVFCLS